jgi:hypothetical protein
MAISLSSLGTNVTNGGTTCSVASITPTGSAVFAAIVVGVGTSTQPTVTSVTGCGLTWTAVASVNGDATGGDRQSTFLYQGIGTPSSGTVTVTIPNSSRIALNVIDAAGVDGTTPVVQSATNTTASGTTSITVTLAAFADATNNAAFGVWGVQNNTANIVTPGTGFTELAETNQGDTHLETEWKLGQDTSVDWSTSGGSTFRSGAIAVELAAGSTTLTISCQAITASTTLFNPTIINTQEIVFNVLNATSTIFNPIVDYNVALNVVTTTTTLFSPALDYNVLLNVVNSTSTVFDPTIINTQEIVFDVLNTTSTLFNPTVLPPSQSVAFTLINATSTVLDPGSEMILQLSVVNTGTTLFSPALDYNVVMNVLNTTSSILQPALMDNIDLQLLSTTSTLFNPGLNQDVVIPVINATENVLTPNVPAAGAQVIDFDIISDDSTIFAPTTFTTVVVPVISIPGTVESPSLSYEIGLQVVLVTTIICVFVTKLLDRLTSLHFL